MCVPLFPVSGRKIEHVALVELRQSIPAADKLFYFLPQALRQENVALRASESDLQQKVSGVKLLQAQVEVGVLLVTDE